MSEKSTQIARQRLDTPREPRFRVHFDADAVGRVGETVAHFLGTGRYLAIQTTIVIFWIALNLFAIRLQWDPYPFILLNLAFSTQAAYAAPLILLAQNRQENRDRVALEEDRMRSAQTKADTEFLARELAALRIALGEVTTRDYLRRELEDLRDALLSPEEDEPDSETAKSAATRGGGKPKSARRSG
ncbi:DUF1003 domain-containing protein [Aldersonia sp. NBC_00410]|uniref:DUF1003 domain-containing protein n=1 Tax=Aldersonia sp. NBC_00410 TaxID=2975954 RepID=UPI00225BD95E|nr:DUF1003 domain-containing protein [Aldersonia sp. NBC_00410]MCX5043735.1 DUF1003 domain-containing protein [Aldersonia sp. NBC_00410]